MGGRELLVGVAVFWGCLLSSVEAAVQGPGMAAGEGSTGDPSRDSCAKPRSTGAVVFSQQQTKKPPPQTQSPRSHLPSLSGRASLGASVPKGAREWPPGLWLSAAWPDGPWPWPARPGSRPGLCLPPPSTRPWPKCECWLPLLPGRGSGAGTSAWDKATHRAAGHVPLSASRVHT